MNYSLSPYGLALISGGFTVVGVLTGALINNKFASRLAEINDRRTAIRIFISTFHRELSGLYPYPINWPENIDGFLRSKFTVLNAAVGEFRHYLPKGDWDSFDQAWFCFYSHTGRDVDMKNCQCYHNYMAFGSNPNFKENFKHDVDNLLKFAKLT